MTDSDALSRAIRDYRVAADDAAEKYAEVDRIHQELPQKESALFDANRVLETAQRTLLTILAGLDSAETEELIRRITNAGVVADLLWKASK